MESNCTNDEDAIAKELQYTGKDLVTTELSTFIEKLVDDILRHYARCSAGIWSVLYHVGYQMMLDLPRKNFIGDTFEAHSRAKWYGTNVAVDRLSQRLLTSNTFMASIAIFVKRRTDTAMDEK